MDATQVASNIAGGKITALQAMQNAISRAEEYSNLGAIVEIDAENAVVGRLASIIALIVRGKNKATFTPHMDDGDFVVVKNVEQAKFTGKKFKDKKYYRHTGHPGGIKEITPEKLLEKNKPGESLKLAVKRMLPGGVLGRKQLTKVKIYAGEEHPHAAQNPTLIDLGKLNSKNLIRN